MYNNGKSTLAYMCYPYSSDPKLNTKKACGIARAIMNKHPNIFIILPHTAVDITLFGFECVMDNRKKHKIEDHLRAENMEYIILEKIDLFIVGTDKDKMSAGMSWEFSYVNKLNREHRKQIDIKFANGELLTKQEYEEVLRNVK